MEIQQALLEQYQGIPDTLIENWADLTYEMRLIAVIVAEEARNSCDRFWRK